MEERSGPWILRFGSQHETYGKYVAGKNSYVKIYSKYGMLHTVSNNEQNYRWLYPTLIILDTNDHTP
jgi:hypothetical protein